MGTLDFDFEFYSEAPDPNDELKTEAERRLRQLAEGHSDLIGASVAVEPAAQNQNAETLLYQARIVAYIRPSNLAATEQAESAEAALKGALEAIERQIREHREKLREQWKQP
jgi:ribosome-associated translation inhibitor RaiA